MATTGIWKIEKRLDHVLDYVMNIEKTIKNKNSNYQEFHKFDEFNNLSFNSEEECYTTGINCLPNNAYDDMTSTKECWNKKGGILGYHAFQSFKEGEVTPEQAHYIGLKLAEEMWGDKYEVIVSTHTNTGKIHNHFVINSVSFKDGKKYHDCNETYALFRHLSDSLCQEYGLSVVKNNKGKKINYDNYYKSYVAKNNYHTTTKQDIDRAIAMAYSYKDFENIMIKMGYNIINRYGKLSVRREPFKKNIRIERAFGYDYSIEEIKNRITKEKSPRIPFVEELNPNNRTYRTETINKSEKAHGLYGLYKYYCYLLNTYPKKHYKKRLSPELRLELKKLDDISKQTELLVSNKIETYEQFLLYKENLSTDIKELSSKREYLWKKIKRIQNEEDKKSIRYEIDAITQVCNSKKEEVRLCDGIEKRAGIVNVIVEELEDEKGKERFNNEF